MSKISKHRSDLEPLLSRNPNLASYEHLRQYLLCHSALPGRRGNIELAHVFGNIMGDYADVYEDEYWKVCQAFLNISVDEAPVNTAKEFLPFCGVIGIGAIGATLPNRCPQALSLLRIAASDPRWRIREAVAMGLQRMLSASPTNCLEVINDWVDSANLLEMRATAAAVAEPLLLHNEVFNQSALNLHKKIIKQYLMIEERKKENARILRKALGYTLSVVVSAIPEEGFAFMAVLSEIEDTDLAWILRENLKKKRLSYNYPDRVYHIKQLMRKNAST